MNRKALNRLVLARAAGWSYDRLADLYDTMKRQIEAAVPGWRATRVKCVDGSHAFIGSKGPVLVILTSGRIFRGRFASDGLISHVGLKPLPDGSVAFRAPDLTASGTVEVM